MTAANRTAETYRREWRLFMEEICCNLLRFYHAEQDNIPPERVKVNQEVSLGTDGSFADICIRVPDRPAYYVEVKPDYAPEELLSVLVRKYGPNAPLAEPISKVLLVAGTDARQSRPDIEDWLKAALRPGLALEIWDESKIQAEIRARFHCDIATLSEKNILELRAAIDQAKGRHAFGETWTGDLLQSALLWHFGFWRLRDIHEKSGRDARAICPPGMYRDVAVIMADLCSFSSFVRDTRDDDVVRQCLTSFYSKARYEILNTGGMMYQFVGDEVIGLYGLPDQSAGYVEDALECARRLLEIGNSISHEWQRQIDRVQQTKGVHVGTAVGDLQIVSLRPFGRAHLGAISDCVNMAARLLAAAGANEIVASNSFYKGLTKSKQSRFQELESIDAKNVGKIKAWKSTP